MKFKFGLDLGSSFTAIYKKGEGIICKEPTLLCVQGENSKYNLVAVGKDCLNPEIENMEKTLSFSPIEEGKIKSVEYTTLFLKNTLKKLFKNNEYKKFGWYVALPSGISEQEKNKYIKILNDCKITSFELIPSALCLCIGAGLDFDGNNYVFVADIGASKTDIAVVNMLKIVNGATIGIGGNTIDKAIVQYVQKNHHVKISEKKAEQVKVDIASLYSSDMACVDIKGISLVKDKIIDFTLYAKDICACVNPVFDEISNVIKATVNECDEKVQEILLNDVLYITGSTSKIPGTEEFFANSTGIKTKVVEKSENFVIIGLGILLGR